MFCIETGFSSLNKYGEELCGDRVEIINRDDSVTMVLADGLGSGVKANILSTLTSKILGTMIADGLEMADAVQTVAHTLPVCSQRGIAYSTFSVLNVKNDGSASLFQYDNPEAIYLHEAKCTGYPMSKATVYGKDILESRLSLRKDDMILLISDGVVHAGIGKIFNLGWQHANVRDFTEQNFRAGVTAKDIASQLIGACRQLYIDKPGDDATVAVARIRGREVVNVLIGPPRNPADAEGMVREFLSSPGKKAVCGGTTSQIVAGYLHEKVSVRLEYFDPRVPPTASIKGIDLVTEGVLTIRRVVEILNEYRTSTGDDDDSLKSPDGASLLAKLLVVDSTDVNFFVGTAVNPAHRDPGFPAGLALKQKLVCELAECLRGMGKKVGIQYY